MIGIFNIMQLFAVWALATNEYEECKIGYVLVVIYVIVIFCFITSSMIILIWIIKNQLILDIWIIYNFQFYIYQKH